MLTAPTELNAVVGGRGNRGQAEGEHNHDLAKTERALQ